MAQLIVRVTGIEAVRMAMQQENQRWGERRIIQEITAAFDEANTLETPRISGRLRRSLQINVGKKLVTLNWKAPYAAYVQARGKSAGFADRVARRALQILDRRFMRAVSRNSRRRR